MSDDCTYNIACGIEEDKRDKGEKDSIPFNLDPDFFSNNECSFYL